MAKTMSMRTDDGRKFDFRLNGDMIERRAAGAEQWVTTNMRRHHIEAIRALWITPRSTKKKATSRRTSRRQSPRGAK